MTRLLKAVLVRSDRAPGGYMESRARALAVWEVLFETRLRTYFGRTARNLPARGTACQG
ncbi:Hypothetical protein AA314_07737 [Archangium gephyra]|uniref:Uncharacterized protein n=1 Tax=Archangium gephyra TaxID=48 RepID=A0AAC8QFD0_9BACT|nr:Hypothetical protein AA314_07737 [Archangium gephyra]